MQKTCKFCKKHFNTKDKRRKFCSLECSHKGRKKTGTFQKGHVPWNLGLDHLSKEAKEAIAAAHRGTKHKKETRKKMSLAQKKRIAAGGKKYSYPQAESHPNWKGDKVSYRNCHAWVRRNYKKTGVCEFCGNQTRTEWSNTDHNYHRVRNDWQELCRSCHHIYDTITNIK